MENDNTNSLLLQRISVLERKVTKFQDLHNSQSRLQHKSSQITAAQDLFFKQRVFRDRLTDQLRKLRDIHCSSLRGHKCKFKGRRVSSLLFEPVGVLRMEMEEDNKSDSLDTLIVQLKQHFIELQEGVHFNTQSRCCKFHRQHKCSHARDAQGLRKRVVSMKNANTDTSLTQRIIQIEQCETEIEADEKEIKKGQAEIQEMFKRFLFGQNTGPKVVEAVPNGDVDEACIEEKVDVKEATLYFRVGGRMFTTTFLGIEVGKWFSIPPLVCVDSEGCISPFFKEPPCDLGFKITPLAIGHHIILISDVKKGDVDIKPFRHVLYLNTQNVKEADATPWERAPYLEGEHAQVCHFLVADHMIYAFGFLKNGHSLCVSCIDFDHLDLGWEVVFDGDKGEPCSLLGPLYSFFCIPASTIEFAPNHNKPGRCPQRALIFSHSSLLTYDFKKRSYGLSELHEMFRFNEIHCSLFPDGGRFFYLLIRDFHDRFSLAVYNHHEKDRGFTQVSGLDDYLPEDCELPVLRLVDLGNGRLCLVWPRVLGANTEVHCTKFIVVEELGKYHATIVSFKVYTVKSFSLDNFEAVVVCSSEMISEFEEENALGLGAGKEKLTTGANSDGQITK